MNRRDFLARVGIGVGGFAAGAFTVSVLNTEDPRDKLTAAEHATRARAILPGIIDDMNSLRMAPTMDGGSIDEPLIVFESNPNPNDYPRDAIYIDPANITQADIEALEGPVARMGSYFGRLQWDVDNPDGEGAPDVKPDPKVAALIEEIGKDDILKGSQIGGRFETFKYHFGKGQQAAPAATEPGVERR